MLAVPRWPETARLPNDKIVVSALKVTARGVLVRSNDTEPEFTRTNDHVNAARNAKSHQER